MKEKLQIATIATIAFSSFMLTWLLLSGENLTLTPIGENPAPTNTVNFFFVAPLLYCISMIIMGFTFAWAIISTQQNKTTH